MRFAVVVVTWNGAPWIEPCLRSILTQSHPPAVVVVVDNASGDGSLAIVRRLREEAARSHTPLLLVEQPANVGFTSGANTGMRRCLGLDESVDAIVLVNQDATLDREWLAQAAQAFAADAHIGAVGGLILAPDRQTVQHAGGALESGTSVGRHIGHHVPMRPNVFDAPRAVDFVTAAAMALRVDALADAGLFNEVFSPGYYEDVELCARLQRADWTTWYWPKAVATHVESASFSDSLDRLRLSHRNRLIFLLPQLADPDRRVAFVEAERQFVESASWMERRGLSLAYLSALLRLPRAAGEREPRVPLRRSQAASIASAIAGLRQFTLGTLRRGA